MRRLLIFALLVAACSPSETTVEIQTSSTSTSTTVVETTTTTERVDFAVSSPAFDDGAPIPAEYTCDGVDVNPELDIVGIPKNTESLVVIVHDPDAPLGTWDHWVEYDIEAGPDPLTIARDTAAIGTEGVNSWNLPGYMGPCPPEGEEHQYFFTVYALSSPLRLEPKADSAQVEEAMDGSRIASVELMGTYAR